MKKWCLYASLQRQSDYEKCHLFMNLSSNIFKVVSLHLCFLLCTNELFMKESVWVFSNCLTSWDLKTKSNQSKPIDYRIVSCCLQLVVSIDGKQVHGLEFSLSQHQISKSLQKTSPQIDSEFLDDLFFSSIALVSDFKATVQARWDKVVNYANICCIKMCVIVTQQYMFSLQMCPIQISCIVPRKYL